MKKTLVNAMNNVRNSSLKNPKFIANIAVKTDAFSKNSFFEKNELVKLSFWNGFTDLILKSLPDEVPAFEGNVLKTRLTKRVYDSEILNKLRNPESFTMSEFLAIIKDLLQKRPSGKNGALLNNSYANIFYVRLKNKRVVAVVVRWRPSHCWDLSVRDLDNHSWYVGYCVFSRS